MIHLHITSSDHRINDLVYEPILVWTKQNITIAFLNGNSKERLEFRRIFFEWFKCTHIHFTEIPLDQRADIRVGFRLDGAQSLSLLGSSSTEYSINLTSKTVYRDYQRTNDPSMIIASVKKRTVSHEGGHSLAVKHEHSYALANISWKARYLKQTMFPHKTKDFIYTNYLEKSSLNKSLGPFDE
jgi:hypothetical protein